MAEVGDDMVEERNELVCLEILLSGTVNFQPFIALGFIRVLGVLQ